MDVTPPIADGAPETLIVDFEGDDTRIQLNEAQKTVWTKDDQVSVFYRSNANQLWKYTGETGERTAVLKCVDAGNATESMKRVVVVYPYNDNYYINTETYNVQASLPATQHYLADSYGLDGNIMISSAEYNQVTLKNVCGWLKLQLTGEGEVVNSITFKGNNGEQVAGELYINSADATSVLASDMGNIAEDEGENVTGSAGANLSFDDVALTEVTLDCGEGVTLGSEATAFYIALPPQTFEKGFTVDVNCKGYNPMNITTQKVVTIERNHIQPMAEVAFSSEVRTIANNEIWYTATEKIDRASWTFDTFGANIISHEWDATTGEGIIAFDCEITQIGVRAFYDCDSLKSIIFNKSIKSIENFAFAGCDLLSQVVIPGNIEEVGSRAFASCTNLSSIILEAGETELSIPHVFLDVSADLYVDRNIKGAQINYMFSDAKLRSITIGPNVKYIDQCVFGYCEELQSLKFEENSQLERIGEYAFAASNIPSEVHIPESVVEIDPCAFGLTTGITNFRSKSPYYRDGVFGELIYDDRTLFRYPSSRPYDGLVSSGAYDKIGAWAFSGGDIKRVYLVLEEAIEIGDYAFWRCGDLKEFEPYHSGYKMLISYIGDSAFGETAVEELNFLDSTFTTINATFRGSVALHTLYLPATLTEIGERTFEDCSSLTSLYIAATTPPTLSRDAFNVVAEGLSIYVPAESVSAYKTAEVWSDYADYIVGYDFEKGEVVPSEPKPADNEIWYTTTDGEMAELAYAVTNNINPAPTQSYRDDIGCYVVTFSEECYGSSGLTNPCGFSLFDDNSKNKIKTLQFSNGDRLFDNFVNDVGAWKASEMTSLEEINIPDNVTYIKERLFSYLFDLKRVIIGSNVTSIEAGAFEGCWGITSITLPENLESIGSLALWDTGITELIIPDKVQTLYTGNVPSSVVSLTIGYSVTNLKEDVWTTRDLSVVYCKPTTPPDNLKFLFYEIDRDMTVYVPTNSVDAYRTILDQYDRVTVKEYDF